MYLFATYYFYKFKIYLKSIVYKYFAKLGQQTKKQQFMKVLLNKSFADVFSSLLDVFDWCSLVQFKKNIIRKEMSLYQIFGFLWKKIWRNALESGSQDRNFIPSEQKKWY